jgi:hypothetical protein
MSPTNAYFGRNFIISDSSLVPYMLINSALHVNKRYCQQLPSTRTSNTVHPLLFKIFPSIRKLQSESHTQAYCIELLLCAEKCQITDPRFSFVYRNSLVISSRLTSFVPRSNICSQVRKFVRVMLKVSSSC